MLNFSWTKPENLWDVNAQTALINSKNHWKRIWLKESGEKPYAKQCALCNLFYYMDCFGCPLYLTENQCEASFVWRNAVDEFLCKKQNNDGILSMYLLLCDMVDWWERETRGH